jgi:RNA-directed DNA polymerase
MVHESEKSDLFIVAKKPRNKPGRPGAEAVERREGAEGNAGEPRMRRTPRRGSMFQGLDRVRQAAKARKKERFTALLHHVDVELLRDAYYWLKRNAAPGVDGLTWKAYEQDLEVNVVDLHARVHRGAYRALSSRRQYIAKADGWQRPLGIAALEDKIVQRALVEVLNAIYEEDFLGFSYGFRPGRSQHDCLDALATGITRMKVSWIVDADIRSFFDSVSHEWLIRFVEHRVGDPRVIRLIRKWLKAGVMEDAVVKPTEVGTPQGAVASPLLANIYLHYVFDLWAHRWRGQCADGDVIVVRYADDTIVGFQYEGEARTFLSAVQDRLKQFGLAVNAQKTRLIEFGRFAESRRQRRGLGRPETFDFLGFTHCCSKTRQGYFKMLRLTMKKRMRATLAAIRVELRRKLHQPVAHVGRWLKRVVQGYFNYHAVPDNLRRLEGFRDQVCRAWLQSLRRRSQRHRMTWVRFKRLIDRYVPRCRQQHPYPPQRNRATT